MILENSSRAIVSRDDLRPQRTSLLARPHGCLQLLDEYIIQAKARSFLPRGGYLSGLDTRLLNDTLLRYIGL